MENFKIIKSSRGGDILQYLGHEYLKKDQPNRNGDQIWRCRFYNKFKCRSRTVTNGELIVKEPSEHCHAADCVQSSANALLSKMRCDAASNQDSSRNILGDNILQATDDVLSKLPKKSLIERNLRRIRQKNNAVAPDPNSINFDIPNEYEDLIIHDSGREDPQRILMIGDQNSLLNLYHNEIWICDGTFAVVPNIFFQLYTIHTQIGNSYPPCVYFLLPNKTENTYRRMLEILLNFLPNAEPARILLDFEVAAMNAFRMVFQQASIGGCFFHMTQSIIRKVNDHGLKIRYETDHDFAIKVKCLSALAFVPVEDIEELFGTVVEQFPQDDDGCMQLLTYFESNFIKGPATRNGNNRPPRFPPTIWNHFSDVDQCIPKTTNASEGGVS